MHNRTSAKQLASGMPRSAPPQGSTSGLKRVALMEDDLTPGELPPASQCQHRPCLFHCDPARRRSRAASPATRGTGAVSDQGPPAPPCSHGAAHGSSHRLISGSARLEPTKVAQQQARRSRRRSDQAGPDRRLVSWFIRAGSPSRRVIVIGAGMAGLAWGARPS